MEYNISNVVSVNTTEQTPANPHLFYHIFCTTDSPLEEVINTRFLNRGQEYYQGQYTPWT